MDDCNCSSQDYKCTGLKHSSNCVLYQGETISALGICHGEPITKSMETILNLLQDYAEGEGIVLSEITGNCTFVTQSLANQNKNLSNLIQVLFDNQCTLRELIQEIENDANSPFSFDLKCLTTPVNPSRDQILQATIDLLCLLKEDVDEIKEDLEDNTDPTNAILSAVNNLIGNFALSNINACPTSSLKKSGMGSAAQLEFVGFVPIGGIIFYAGSTGNFDQTGKGLASACMENFAIANGSNGTIDLRGFAIAGATQNVPGQNALLPQATIFGDPDTLTQIGNRKGINKITLTSVNQIPDHEHNTLENPHIHTAFGNVSQNSPEMGNGGAGLDTYPGTVNTTPASTGLQVKGVKNRTATQPIENRQPTYYGIFIQRIS